jgi:hypothetical protein
MAVFPGHPVAVPLGDRIPGVANRSNLPCSRKGRARGGFDDERRVVLGCRNSARLAACYRFDGDRPIFEHRRLGSHGGHRRVSVSYRRGLPAHQHHLVHFLSISRLSEIAGEVSASMVALT